MSLVRITRRRLLAAAGAGLLGGGIYAFGIEPRWLRTWHVEVPVRGLGAGLDGYRIAQMSDFHVGAGVPPAHVADAVARALAFEPDLVALTGDFVHRGAGGGSAEEAARLLAPLRARDGVVAVMGNHDADVYASDGFHADRVSLRRVKGALGDAGIRVLENERISVARGGAAMHVVGLGDLWTGLFDRFAARPDGAPTVVLSHNPDTAPDLAADGAGLVLSGHTHGGQVSVPFLGLLTAAVVPLCAETFRLGGTRLYVNRGVGWLRRVRLFVRPEVTLLTLRPAT